jgi:Zn-dependent protease with chaperone function
MGQSETKLERTAESISVERWPSEIPLLIFVALASAGIWLLLAVSVIGIFYVLLIGLFLFVAHVVSIAHIRGSGVRLGPGQFPELFRRVEVLAAQMGMESMPEAYLMEAGGTLNAFATKFLRSRLIVLYSDLLDACGEDVAARDMVIAHELGHIKAGHFRWVWFLAPGMLVPFLGSIYSQARELTCDRYGAALCGDPDGSLRGLAILAAGKDHGRLVNLQGFAEQRRLLDTGFMTFGKWLSTHPPLCERIAALRPSLVAAVEPSSRGLLRALAMVGGLIMIPSIASVVFIATLLPKYQALIQEAQNFEEEPFSSSEPAVDTGVDVDDARYQVEEQTAQLAVVVGEYHMKMGVAPPDAEALYGVWRSLRSGEEEPVDPFDGSRYGYYVTDDSFVIWSSGPDGAAETEDDILKEFPLVQ